MVIAIAIVGTLIGALQAATLFILGDLRDRVMRLETGQMMPAPAPTWKVRGVAG